MWELWDSPFEGTGMNSRNHHMFTSFSYYLVTQVAGVSIEGYDSSRASGRSGETTLMC